MKQFLQNNINSSDLATIYSEVLAELGRATKKFPSFPCDPVHSVAVMAEESGEATQASLQWFYEGGNKEKLRGELVQTMAMCIRNIHGIDSGEITIPAMEGVEG